MDINGLIETLHKENCSCAIWSGDKLTICRRRGVMDLLCLLHDNPALLRDAMIADKVVGKGAAALMSLGGVVRVHADVISAPALRMLQSSGIETGYGRCVPNIINRAGDDICPVEKLCSACESPEECLPLIENFVKSH